MAAGSGPGPRKERLDARSSDAPRWEGFGKVRAVQPWERAQTRCGGPIREGRKRNNVGASGWQVGCSSGEGAQQRSGGSVWGALVAWGARRCGLPAAAHGAGPGRRRRATAGGAQPPRRPAFKSGQAPPPRRATDLLGGWIGRSWEACRCWVCGRRGGGLELKFARAWARVAKSRQERRQARPPERAGRDTAAQLARAVRRCAPSRLNDMWQLLAWPSAFGHVQGADRIYPAADRLAAPLLLPTRRELLHRLGKHTRPDGESVPEGKG
jgi:hypothetical protein